MSARALTILALVLAGPAIAQTPAPTASQSRDDPNRVICRRESVTGSLAQAKKVCMTRAEWIARSRDTQDGAADMQQRGLINSCAASEPGKC